MVLEPEKKGSREKVSKKVPKRQQLTLPDLVVLSLLSEEPMHGYQLVSQLEIRDVKDWAAISRPQVYYSLNKLLKLKMIAEAKDSDSSLGPDRTVYKINANGTNGLADSLSKPDWARQRPPPPFLTWMALSAHLPKSAIRSLFEERRKYLRIELDREKKTLAAFESESGAMIVAGRLMVDLTVQMFELELKWLEKAERQMLARS